MISSHPFLFKKKISFLEFKVPAEGEARQGRQGSKSEITKQDSKLEIEKSLLLEIGTARNSVLNSALHLVERCAGLVACFDDLRVDRSSHFGDTLLDHLRNH